MASDVFSFHPFYSKEEQSQWICDRFVQTKLWCLARLGNGNASSKKTYPDDGTGISANKQTNKQTILNICLNKIMICDA